MLFSFPSIWFSSKLHETSRCTNLVLNSWHQVFSLQAYKIQFHNQWKKLNSAANMYNAWTSFHASNKIPIIIFRFKSGKGAVVIWLKFPQSLYLYYIHQWNTSSHVLCWFILVVRMWIFKYVLVTLLSFTKDPYSWGCN